MSLEDIRKILAGKARVSKENADAIKNILKAHGADTLSALSTEHYAAVIKEASLLKDE